MKSSSALKPMKPRISKLIVKLSEGLHEREEIIAITLLSALSGQSVFLYGLPGTAKSLIARRVSQAFKDSEYFEYLMQRFSTPEEVFGPVSIQKLKDDKYERKTAGYLPTASFAFLDEIWKSSPAILNTLLTIINERKFRNGDSVERVPLKALVAASNETPPSNTGLDALYDRFILRVIVNPLENEDNFQSLLGEMPAEAELNISEDLQFSETEWRQIHKSIADIKISAEVFNIIRDIRVEVTKWNKKHDDETIYISDRRWQNISIVLKTAALVNDRDEVLPIDTLLLYHCLWNLELNRIPLEKIINKSIEKFSSTNTKEYLRWRSRFATIEKDIIKDCFYEKDVYKKVPVGSISCYPVEIKNVLINYWEEKKGSVTVYVPVSDAKKASEVFPLDKNGNKDERAKVSIKMPGLCSVKLSTKVQEHSWDRENHDHHTYKKHGDFKIPIDIKHGSQKEISSTTQDHFIADCEKSLKDIGLLIESAKSNCEAQRDVNDTPFVAASNQDIVLSALLNHIKNLENEQLNAQQLLLKVKKCEVRS